MVFIIIISCFYFLNYDEILKSIKMGFAPYYNFLFFDVR